MEIRMNDSKLTDVMPAKAGIQKFAAAIKPLDPGVRRGDNLPWVIPAEAGIQSFKNFWTPALAGVTPYLEEER
jgi:hypothetical protein